MMHFKIKSFQDYKETYDRSVKNPEGFWAEIANHYNWIKPWDRILDWNFSEPDVKWFLNAKLNITQNCIDRHLAAKADKTAIL